VRMTPSAPRNDHCMSMIFLPAHTSRGPQGIACAVIPTRKARAETVRAGKLEILRQVCRPASALLWAHWIPAANAQSLPQESDALETPVDHKPYENLATIRAGTGLVSFWFLEYARRHPDAGQHTNGHRAPLHARYAAPAPPAKTAVNELGENGRSQRDKRDGASRYSPVR
jgi:hypothetical protein